MAHVAGSLHLPGRAALGSQLLQQLARPGAAARTSGVNRRTEALFRCVSVSQLEMSEMRPRVLTLLLDLASHSHWAISPSGRGSLKPTRNPPRPRSFCRDLQ